MKGQNLRILVGAGSAAKCIARAKSCTINIEAQLEDTSTKDSTGDWAENEGVGKSWNMTTDSLVVLEDDNGGKTVLDFIDAVGTKFAIEFDETSGTQNRAAQNSDIKRTGYAILQSVSINSTNRQQVTYSTQWTGSGPLSAQS